MANARHLSVVGDDGWIGLIEMLQRFEFRMDISVHEPLFSAEEGFTDRETIEEQPTSINFNL